MIDVVDVESIEFDQMIAWAADIASGMRYLHHEAVVTIIHRDLKSLNILVVEMHDQDLVLKICDFGSSRQVWHAMSAVKLTRTRVFLGLFSDWIG